MKGWGWDDDNFFSRIVTLEWHTFPLMCSTFNSIQIYIRLFSTEKERIMGDDDDDGNNNIHIMRDMSEKREIIQFCAK